MIKSTVLLAALGVSACATVRMPTLDVVKSPEFSEEAANIPTSFPRAVDAPTQPQDIRSAVQWDRDARALQALRDSATPLRETDMLSEAEIEARFEALKSEAQAYRRDDAPDAGTTDLSQFTPPPRRR